MSAIAGVIDDDGGVIVDISRRFWHMHGPGRLSESASVPHVQYDGVL